MKWRSTAIPWTTVAILFLVIVALGIHELSRRFQAQFVIIEGDRPYAFSGLCLTDSEAIEQANHAMRLAGFSELNWQPSPIGRDQVAPDGSKDIYFSRNTINPNDGFVDFVNSNAPNQSIFFSIHQVGNSYHFTLSRGK